MPCRNAGKWLSNSITSVLRQSFSNLELLIIDDASTDNSCELIRAFQTTDSRIKLIELPKHSGAAIARNTGLEISKGRYITFLDADDIWLKTKVEEQLHFIQKNKFSFIFSAYEIINERDESVREIGVPGKINYKELLKTCAIGCLTVMYDSTCFGKVKMPLIQRRQDFGFWLLLLTNTEFAYGMNKVLARYRVHENSLSNNKITSSFYTWKLFRFTEKLPILQCFYYFSHYAIRGLLRNKFPRVAISLGLLSKVE